MSKPNPDDYVTTVDPRFASGRDKPLQVLSSPKKGGKK